MPTLHLRLLTLIVALFAFSACSGTSPDTACTDSAAARCAQRDMCTGGVGITKTFGDMTTCLAREKQSCLNALAAKDNGNTPAKTEQCTTALKTESCADYFAGNTPAACVNTGTLTDGTACAFPGQCMATYCTGLANAACGTCGQPVASGGDCSNNATCARGQICFTTTMAGMTKSTCLTEAAAGAQCSRTQPCAAGLTCVGAVGGANPMPGTCMTAGGMPGVACDPLDRTAPGCDRSHGLWCNAVSKTCTTITFVANGATCGVGTDGNLTDCTAGACYGNMNGGPNPITGTCKADAADGTSCDTANGPGCVNPARCVTATGSTAGTCELSDGSKC